VDFVDGNGLRKIFTDLKARFSDKLDKSAQAADSAKLGGKSPDAFAAASHSHNANAINDGILPVARGGTNRSSQATGNMNYATSATANGVIAPPVANVDQYLKHSGAVDTPPVWTSQSPYAI
jgi:hypothetical protein